MKRLSLLFAFLAMTAVLGCSSITVNYDYDKKADLTSFKTYAWLPDPATPSKNVKDELARNSLVDQRVKNAVNRGLAEKGFRQDAKKPDFLVSYHTGVEDKVNVADWGYNYSWGYPYWGPTGRNISVHQYKEGTLILDFISPKNLTLVWRGIAQAVLPTRETPEKSEKLINEAVDKILKGFPPSP
jgi:hypothetical protein